VTTGNWQQPVAKTFFEVFRCQKFLIATRLGKNFVAPCSGLDPCAKRADWLGAPKSITSKPTKATGLYLPRKATFRRYAIAAIARKQ